MLRSHVPVVGSPAPDFTAEVSGGSLITLSQFRHHHHVVLSFYPRDFSWGCTRQLCGYRDRFEEFQRRHAVVIAISGNRSESQTRFAQRHRFPFLLISDRDRRIRRAYGVLRLGGLVPLPKRITFVINQEGIIRGTIHHELAVERHLAESLVLLDEMLLKGKPIGRP